MSYDCVEFGKAIRHARKLKSMTAGDLGKILSPPVSHTAVCKWETGKSKPSVETLLQLSKILGFDIRTFFAVESTESKNADFETCKDAQEIYNCYNKMSEEQKNAIMTVVRSMVE